MSYHQRFNKFNETLIRIIDKLECENDPSSLLKGLKTIYRHTSNRDSIYHAAWVSLFEESHRVIDEEDANNKKAAKVVLRIMNDIEEEMQYE